MQILSDNEIRAVCPSAFAERPWHGTSERYAFVPTSRVIRALRGEGFQPVQARQSRCRIPGKAPFTRHMIRFRQEDAPVIDGGSPEVVLLNAHDRTASYRVEAGFIRFACDNGLILGDVAGFAINHMGDIVERVLEATWEVARRVPLVAEAVGRMRSIELDTFERLDFARRALKLRYLEDPPVYPLALLASRRAEDEGDDLWSVYNRIQENLLRGLRVHCSPTGRRRTMRSIRSVQEDVRLNKELWSVAAVLERAKRGESAPAETVAA